LQLAEASCLEENNRVAQYGVSTKNLGGPNHTILYSR
jgi:hypothetical protein